MTQPGEPGPVVSLRSVFKKFGDETAVDGVDLDIPAGICFGLLGPNGAGKTTTLRMVYGAARPTSGRITALGLDVGERSREVRGKIGVTLQDNILIDSLDAETNLKIFGRYHLIPEPRLSERVREVMDFLELNSRAALPVVALSGGFKRRLSIGLSLMNDPRLLILDEPTTGLDPAVRQLLWSRIRSLRSSGTSILVTTHYMDEAQRLCDELAIMDKGKIVARGAPLELVHKHLDREALEVECTPQEELSVLDLVGEGVSLRSGERLVLFGREMSTTASMLRRELGDGRPMFMRPANLEDLFLKMTGASLVED